MSQKPMCFLCDETFKFENNLIVHLMTHSKKELVNALAKYRINYN